MKRRTEELGLAALGGYLLGGRRHRRHHVLRDVALFLLFGALLLAAVVPLLMALWPYFLGLALLAALLLIMKAHRRRQQPRWPSSSPAGRWLAQRQLPSSQDALDAAFAAGYARGQREARTVERSWGRSLPAYDPEDEDSF